MITHALPGIAIVLLALLCGYLYVSRVYAVARARSYHLAALEYIAEEGCDLPHEFAACFLAGNVEAIARKFPGFQPFLLRRVAELESEAA